MKCIIMKSKPKYKSQDLVVLHVTHRVHKKLISLKYFSGKGKYKNMSSVIWDLIKNK